MRCRPSNSPEVPDQRRWDLPRRHDAIGIIARDCALRHPRRLRRVRRLDDDKTARPLDRVDPGRSIVPHPGKHYRRDTRPLVLRNRSKELVDRTHAPVPSPTTGPSSRSSLPRPAAQASAAHRKHRRRRDHVEMVGLDGHSIGGLGHGHGRYTREQLHHRALVRWIEVHDHDESQPRIRGHVAEQLTQRLQPARRSAEGDDRRHPRTSGSSARRHVIRRRNAGTVRPALAILSLRQGSHAHAAPLAPPFRDAPALCFFLLRHPRPRTATTRLITSECRR
jgi:hypothetical protein